MPNHDFKPAEPDARGSVDADVSKCVDPTTSNLEPASSSVQPTTHSVEPTVSMGPAVNVEPAISRPSGDPAGRPVDGKSLTIGVLAITASILFVGFLLVTLNPKPAYAIGILDRSDDYIMFTEQTSNSVEHLIVVDAAVKRMNVYTLQNRRTLELLQSIHLDRLPGSAEMEKRKRGG